MSKREFRRRQFLGYLGGMAGAAALAACAGAPAAGRPTLWCSRAR